MAGTTERYMLPLLQAGQAQKEVSHNTAVAAIDALLHLSVESQTINAPPVTPTAPGAWIVGSNPTGTWAGLGGTIAAYDAAGWSYILPREGCLAFVRDTRVFSVYMGGAWSSDGWPVSALKIAGRSVLGAVPATLSTVTGGTVVDVQARAALGSLTAALRAMGLVL